MHSQLFMTEGGNMDLRLHITPIGVQFCVSISFSQSIRLDSVPLQVISIPEVELLLLNELHPPPVVAVVIKQRNYLIVHYLSFSCASPCAPIYGNPSCRQAISATVLVH